MLRWFVTGVIVAIGSAWVAAALHASVRAPVGSVSIGFGLVLGLLFSALATLAGVRISRSLLWGAVALAIVAVLAQHAWLYLDFRRQWQDAMAAAPRFAELSPKPPSPITYFGHELTVVRGVLWCIDATLVIGFAAFAMKMLQRMQTTSNLSPNHTPQPPAPNR
jgi:hypothetical protein